MDTPAYGVKTLCSTFFGAEGLADRTALSIAVESAVIFVLRLLFFRVPTSRRTFDVDGHIMHTYPD